jgi:hypothetical protein
MTDAELKKLIMTDAEIKKFSETMTSNCIMVNLKGLSLLQKVHGFIGLGVMASAFAKQTIRLRIAMFFIKLGWGLLPK